ncbi:hypothetical protein ACOSQ4_030295 [Xanthoceras sorbifolium]
MSDYISCLRLCAIIGYSSRLDVLQVFSSSTLGDISTTLGIVHRPRLVPSPGERRGLLRYGEPPKVHAIPLWSVPFGSPLKMGLLIRLWFITIDFVKVKYFTLF